MLFSVVIPTCNRSDLLLRCLDSLMIGKHLACDQDRRAECSVEVIVTNDGEADDLEVIRRTYSDAVIWIQGPKRGPASNRNNGARAAAGDWLIFVDDDCYPDEEWLRSISQHAADDHIDVIEGKTITPDRVDNPLSQGVENITGGNYWSCNLAIRREAFFRIGGFDEDFLQAGGEDMELAYRIKKEGLRTVFADDAIVYHPTRRLNFRKLLARTFLIKWILLYNLKTAASAPLGSSSVVVLGNLVWDQFVGRIRNTIHLFTRPDRSMWRTRSFYQVWDWLMLPVLIPFLIKWEFKFRKQLMAAEKLAPKKFEALV